MKTTGWLSALAERLTSLRTRRRSATRRGTARGTSLKNHSASWIAERLEDRALLATVSESINNTLTISLSAGEDLVIVSNGTSYSFSSDLNFSPGGISNPGDFSPFGTTSLTLLASGLAYFNTVSIVDAGAAATVRFNSSLAHSYSDNVSVVLNDPNAGTITFSGSESFAGSNSLSATTTKNIVVDPGASITTTNGDLTLSANQQLVPRSGTFVGIDVGNNGLVRSQGNGDVTVLGRGGTIGNANIGVLVRAGADVIGGTNGLLTVQGTGGGAGGGSSVSNNGVEVDGVGSSIASNGSHVFVTGTGGGTGSGFNNLGVAVSNSGVVTAGGAGNVTVVGQGGAGTGGGNRGVLISGGNARITSNLGPVSVTGTEGAGPSVAIDVVNTGVITTLPNNGPITLAGNSMNFDNSATISASGLSSVTLRPRANGVQTYLGGFGDSNGGPLMLSNAELNRVSAGKIVVGSNLAGSVIFGSPIALAGSNTLEVISGGTINDTGSSTAFTDSNLVLQAASGIGTTGPLNVAVSRLEASGGNGGLNVANSGSLIIGGIGPQNGLSVTGGDLSVSATILQVSEPVVNSGTGNVSLSSSGVFGGAELDITASVSSNGGNITLNAVDDIQVLGSLTTSGSGGIDFNANLDSNTDGGIYLFNTVSAGSGGISLSGWNSVHSADLITSGGAITFDLNLQARLDSDVVFNTTNGSAAGAGVAVDVPIIGSGSPRNLTINGGTAGAVNLPESIGFSNNLINNVSLTGGSVTVSSQVVAQGTIDVTATNSFIVNAGAGLTTTGGSQTLTADAISLDTSASPATINAGTGVVTLRPFANGTAIHLGGADSPGSLGLTDAELDRVTSGVLRVGSSSAGTMTITSAISPAGTSTLHLITGAAVNQPSGSITETALAIEAGGTIGLNGSTHTVDTIALTTTNGSIVYMGTFSFSVGDVDGVSGVRNMGSGQTGVFASIGGITINDTAASNDVESNGPIYLNASGNGGTVTIASGASIHGTTGDHFYQADRIDIAGSINAGNHAVTLAPHPGHTDAINLGSTTDAAPDTLELSDAELDQITASRIVVGSTTAGAVTFTAPISMANSDTLVVITGGTINDTGSTTVFTDTSLALNAASGVGTSSALDVAVSNLAATVAAGGINIANTGDLNLTTVGGVSGVSATSNLTISSIGSITVSQPVSLTGGSVLALRAQGGDVGDVIVNSPVTSGTGIVLSASDDITSNTSGTLTGNNGITVIADSDANLSGTINYAAAVNHGSSSVGTRWSLADADGIASGDISGFGSLEKNGSGTLTLAGANNYRGFATIGNGRLNVNGSTASSSTVIVQSATTLGGIGVVNGTVDVRSGGHVAPGMSPGVLSTGNISFSGGSTFDVELAGNFGAGDSNGHDQLNVTGTVSLAGATLSLNTTGLTLAELPGGQTFVIVNNDGTDPILGTFNGLPEGASVLSNMLGSGRDLTISYLGGSDGNDVVLRIASDTTVTLDGANNLVITDANGGNSSDSLTIQSDTTNSVFIISDPGRTIETSIAGATRSGTNTVTVPFASVSGSQILVNTLAGNDSLTIDLSLGNFAKSIAYDGGDPTTASGDSLTLTGGSFGRVTHTLTSASSGTIDVAENAPFSYLGLEPVFDNLSVTDRIFTFNGGTEMISLTDGTTADGKTLIDSDFSESVYFTNPMGSLTINAGSGDDIVNINSADAGLNIDLTINGDAGSDTVNLNIDSLTLASGESVLVNAEAVTTGANADLTTSGTGIIMITADDVAINATSTLVSAGKVTLKPQTAGRPVSLGAETAGSLSVTDSELDRLTAGTIHLGDLSSGSISVSGTFSANNSGTMHWQTAGTVNQAGTSSVVESQLAVEAVGNINIFAYNQVGTIAIRSTNGSVAFGNLAGDLTIGSVDGVHGLVAGGSGGVQLTNQSANLTVTDTPLANDIFAPGSVIVFIGGNDRSMAVHSGAAIVSNGSQTYFADKISLNGSIIAPGAFVSITPSQVNELIDLGSTSDTAVNTLELSDAELDRIVAGTVSIGGTNNGAIYVSQPITHPNATLSLTSGSGVTAALTGALGVTNLAIRASGDVILAGGINAHAVQNFAASNVGSGSKLRFAAAGALTIGSVSGQNGVTTTNGEIQLSSRTGGLTVLNTPAAIDINAGTNAVQVLQAEGVNQTLTIASGAVVAGNFDVFINADNIVLNGNINSSIVGIAPFSPGVTMNLGATTDSAANTLELSDAELDRIATGNLFLGGGSYGAITVTAAITRSSSTNVTLISASGSDIAFNPGSLNSAGGTITFNAGSGGQITSNAGGTDVTGNVIVNGELAPGASPGLFIVAGNVTLSAADTFSVEVNASAMAGVDYDQLSVSGAVNLGNATLNATGSIVAAPIPIVLIDNDGAAPINGTFNGLDEGDTIHINGIPFQISYVGGDGNDVVLIGNQPPNITVDIASVTTPEGTPATNSGTFSDQQGNSTVTLTASVGTITRNNANGTWSWSVSALEGPADPVLVTITATDDFGETATATFTYSVFNVAPSDLNLALDAPVIDETGIALLSGSFIDPGTLDMHTVTVNWGDGSPDTILNLGAGETRFRNISHQYLDDNPSGTGSDNYSISVTVSDDDSGQVSNVASIRVNNVAPEIVRLSLSSSDVDEGQSVSVQGVFRDPALSVPTERFQGTALWSDGVSTPLLIDARTGEFSTSRAFPDDDPSGTPSDPLSVTVTIEDDDLGRDAEQSTPLTIHNVAPELFDLSATSANENGFVTLTGRYTDIGALDTHTLTIDWGEGLPQVVSVSGGSFSVTHQYLDDNPTGTPSDAYSISVTLTDDDSGADSESTMTTITNLAPMLVSLNNSSPECGDAAEGDAVTVSGSFTDIGTLDMHSATIAWGDGSITSAIINQGVGGGTLSGSHAYAAGGIYTITVTLADDDGGTITSTTTTVVTGVGLVGDTLYVIGTDSNDHVTVNQAGSVYRVHANFLGSASFRDVPIAGVSRIVVQVCDGNDLVTISGGVSLSSLIDGGAGDDQLNGGNGSNIILGGEGNDMLVGGSSRDLLIGGRGADRIVGNSSDDLLISGTTFFDSDYAALTTIMSEWNSERTFANRVANIRGTGAGPRLNGSNFLRLGAEVFDDGAVDKLTGSAGSDFFLYNVSQDLLTDFKSGEAIN